MEWILDHLQELFVIAVVIVAVLQKLKIFRPQGGAAPAAEDSEQAERTRRIQEEIRRRILERRGLAPETPPEIEPGPRPFPAAPPMIEAVRPVVVPPPPVAVEAAEQELQRQESLVRQMEEKELTRKAGAVVVPAAAAPTPAPGTGPEGRKVGRILDGLRGPAELRRAIVLREILGPPLALR